jgi:hypothetical protein
MTGGHLQTGADAYAAARRRPRRHRILLERVAQLDPGGLAVGLGGRPESLRRPWARRSAASGPQRVFERIMLDLPERER